MSGEKKGMRKEVLVGEIARYALGLMGYETGMHPERVEYWRQTLGAVALSNGYKRVNNCSISFNGTEEDLKKVSEFVKELQRKEMN